MLKNTQKEVEWLRHVFLEPPVGSQRRHLRWLPFIIYQCVIYQSFSALFASPNLPASAAMFPV